MAKDDSAPSSDYYIDENSGMLIMGSGTGNASSSQQSQEWGQDGQDWEASEDAVYNNTHHVDPPQQKYASFGTSFGKSTWGSKLTQEEEDWTGIVLEPVNEYDDYAKAIFQTQVAVYPVVQKTETGQQFQFLGKCQNMDKWKGWETPENSPSSSVSSKDGAGGSIDSHGSSDLSTDVPSFVPSGSMEFKEFHSSLRA